MRHIRGADAPTDSADIRDAKSTESMGLTAVFLRCGFRGNRPRTPWKSHLRLYGKQLRIFLRNPRQIRTPVRTPKCSDGEKERRKGIEVESECWRRREGERVKQQ